jgi:hypothetical protein
LGLIKIDFIRPESVYFKLIESASPLGENSSKVDCWTSLKLPSHETVTAIRAVTKIILSNLLELNMAFTVVLSV